MAEQSGDSSLPTHPLVSKLADGDGGDFVVLVGFIGPSSGTDQIRLYPDLSFSRYYDIPTSAIRGTWPTDASDENSPTNVAVDAGTSVEEVSVSRRSTGARFLKGAISDHYQPASGGGGADCLQILATTVCTVAGAAPQAAHGGADCLQILATTVCTVAGAAPQAALDTYTCLTFWCDTVPCTLFCGAKGGQAQVGGQRTAAPTSPCATLSCFTANCGGIRGGQGQQAALDTFTCLTFWCETLPCTLLCGARGGQAQGAGQQGAIPTVQCPPTLFACTMTCG